ncbi:MAG: UDP-3-O-(3-hydroxymyristoyl)glucosamine N-acyltransferase [Flammeovirgaceae bacterium]|jgi:UDP-3-O-[3-hydroxymyristoyl] glucosamine N-acyltransferase|nr:UDP-3-O-(3-hydroxymyristoyl)glucosamine N-acyltransferase [Flammeovirgaceae bacterium]
MNFTLEQIAHLIGGKLDGSKETKVNTISSIEDAKEGSITFLSNPKYEPLIYETQASAVIVDEKLFLNKKINTALIRVADSYAAFTALLEAYDRLLSFNKTGIEEPSFINKTATHGSDIYVGAFSYIGSNVKIGDQVKIYPNAYIGDDVTIGHQTIIHPGVRIYAKSVIGSHCTLQAGAVVGSDGFGYAPLEDGSYKKIPQLGNVVLEDHVDVGANTVIDCATFNTTLIKKGVKLDNLIQIGHNTLIGENTVIAAQTGIAGSVKIGENCKIGGQVGIAGHLKIAAKTQIQAQSGVSKNTKVAQTIYGTPAIDFNNYLRSYTVYKKLPKVMKQIEKIEEKLLNL